MKKGIVLFDIKDFLYQGLDKNAPDIELINTKQVETLNVLHTKLMNERERRLGSNIAVPVVDIFLPTGDGYYFLCEPDLPTILDIARCVMAILHTSGVHAYCVAHVGEINVFMDMTGKQNATGFELGFASRLQSVCEKTGTLVCSQNIIDMWSDNEHFNLVDEWHAAKAKDNVEYRWKFGVPKNFEMACAKFS